MPTISQLPPASAISATDEVPISQSGSVCAASIGMLLASTQPAITLDSPALLGRVSIGSGGPEQVDIGIGIGLSGTTLIADGLDHSGFPAVSSLPVESDLVISNQGSPMLMQASLLRGLFSAGPNVAIDSNGVISSSTTATATGTIGSIGELQTVTSLAALDLVAISHGGSDYAIAYGNFLDGVTIDQAQAARPVGNADTLWVAQGTNVMVSQSFGAIWVWVANNLPTYKALVVEITTNTSLDTTVHNGRILVCSQPITLTPLTNNMGSGFQCQVINASAGNVTLASTFVSSNGNLFLTPWQSATLCCVTYSAGTIAFAAMPATTSGTTGNAIPGQVSGLSALGTTATTITVSWQAPSSGGAVVSVRGAISADRNDIMEQQRARSKRHKLSVVGPAIRHELRYRRSRTECDRRRYEFRDIDGGDSERRARDLTITSHRPGRNPGIEQRYPAKLGNPDRRQRGHLLHYPIPGNRFDELDIVRAWLRQRIGYDLGARGGDKL